MKFQRLCALTLPLAIFMTACSEAPKESAKSKEPEGPVEPVTGRYAFHQMYLTARGWSPDLQPLRLRNIPMENVPVQPGKSGAWEATFISPAKGKARIYTYSVVEGPGNLHKGVFGNIEEYWSGKSGTAVPWNIAALKIDSEAAYETAVKRSAEYIKKYPDKPVSYLLEQTGRHPFLAWRVIWGLSPATSDYSVLVNASTGDYLETLR